MEVGTAPADPEASTGSAARFLALLDGRQGGDEAPPARLLQLRKAILLDSLPQGDEGASIRPRVWTLLLGLNVLPAAQAGGMHPLLDAETYQDLVSREPSSMYAKIRNDTFRTLATDKEFLDKVGEERLVRLLEAFVWRQHDAVEHGLASTIDAQVPYVQGLNVLAAPFLYVLPSQLEAFACFTSFIEKQVPRYVQPTLTGVHDALQLVDLCLASIDPPLHAHLLSYNLSAEIYAFPSILTFCAATPPLREVLELWDFLLAWGVGLNVLPMKLLRTFPPLKSREIVPLVVQYIGELRADLYDAIVRHPWDDALRLPDK
ncbi:hypothetical protein Rhopal_001512-T1 [Rhodotorula paludigena]|uniref:Rab-GAP TBC domain-containing protein n=1 Tax=Rhodotorula paludigena TaxID=86838 RepID=A0AAV5G7L7_9BASI|nr:hypothetical protein Rhopal_001512-T1 [Rhodotorula paludigena]